MKSIQLSKSLLFLVGGGLLTVLLLLGACGSDDSDPVLPIITTGGGAHNISVTAVTITSSIEFTQSELITARGVCWGESPAPELGKGTKSTRNGVGAGTFDSQLTKLSISKYYVRAYATIGDKVYYGNEVVIDMNSFVPSITVVEKEGGSANEVLVETTITYTHTAALSEKGICWGRVINPTINLSTKIANSSFSLSFSDAITVPEWTSFYVRGYAITEVGVFYSENIQVINIPPVSFGEVTDIDGNTYKTTTIGDKVWMAENLRVTKYNDGTSIASGFESEFKTAVEGMYTVYDGNGNNLTNFGYLYNGYTVTSDQNVCMTDWHVATPSEWNDLVRRLGGGETAGGRMKAVSDLWATPNTAADNSSGFSALPGGSYCRVCLSNTGIFADKGTDAYFWSSTAVEFYYVTNNLPSVRAKGTGNKNDGLSIRCVKD